MPWGQTCGRVLESRGYDGRVGLTTGKGVSLMNRITLALAVALAALVAAAPIAARPSASAATTVTVTMKEFKFTLSKTKVPHGSVTFKLVDKGKLPHDFAI